MRQSKLTPITSKTPCFELPLLSQTASRKWANTLSGGRLPRRRRRPTPIEWTSIWDLHGGAALDSGTESGYLRHPACSRRPCATSNPRYSWCRRPRSWSPSVRAVCLRPSRLSPSRWAFCLSDNLYTDGRNYHTTREPATHKEQSVSDGRESGLDADLHIAKKPVKNNGRAHRMKARWNWFACRDERPSSVLCLFSKNSSKRTNTTQTNGNASVNNARLMSWNATILHRNLKNSLCLLRNILKKCTRSDFEIY